MEEIKLPYETQSLCPECLKVINATLYEENGKVMIRKTCPDHGEFVDVYWGDAEMFKKAARFAHDGPGIQNPIIKEIDCPFTCGLCGLHKSQTALLNIVLTNRCDLACWYCLPADEVAVFKIDGRVEAKSFGELAENFDFEHKVKVGEIEGEFSVPDNLEVLTFKNGKVRWTKVTKFLRRKFEGDILRIKTKTGREIRLTPEHNVFVYVDGRMVKKRADDLKPDDKLVLLWNLPIDDEVSEIDVIEGFINLPEEEKRKTFVHGVRHVMRPFGTYNPKLRAYGNRTYHWYRRDHLPLNVFYEVYNDGFFELGRDATKHRIPSKIQISPEFAKLIGYFVSDGHYTSKDIRITVGSEETEREILDIIRKLGLTYSILQADGKAKQIVIGSRLMRLVFKYVLGIPEKAENKRLPRMFLQLPRDIKLALLSGLFNGDGFVVRGKRHLSLGYATVSKELARDILYLLASLGIFARIYVIKKEKVKNANYDLYKIHIAGNELKKLVEMISLRKSHRNRLGCVGVRRDVRIKRIGDIYVDEISEITAEHYSGYVYDLEVEDDMHAFLAGDGVLISNCFFYARRTGYVYEPSVEQIRQMVRVAKSIKPVATNAVQLTGGEPTLRDDLIEIIRAIKEEGIDHIQLNTNGIRLALEPDLALKVREAGVNTVYLSFDGVDEKTNPKNHQEVPKILENCRRAELGIVLVPTIIKTVNDHQLGDIIRYGVDNIDIVRGVNFQPVSLVGSMPKREREKYRITIPDAIKKIEEQTDGEISRDDFYPVPSVTPISHFVEALTGTPQYELTTHFACGMATYVFKENGKLLPITRFVDVEGLFEYLNEKAESLTNSRIKTIRALKGVIDIRRFVDFEKAPKEFDISKILFDVLVRHDYSTLGQFHAKALFIGMMHFMDLYNYDIERVKRCEIHYATPDGRIIPFCAFNVMPEIYRDKIHAEFGIPIEEWEKRTGRKLKDDIYRVIRRPKE